MMVRAGLAVMWLLHFLPLPILARLGQGFGLCLWCFARERRGVCTLNLERCFPGWTPAERSRKARGHFQWLGRSILERALLWWSRGQRIDRLIRVTGQEVLDAHRGQPIILLAPHFVGLDAGFTRLTRDHDLASIYANQKNALFNAVLLRGRTRFGHQRLFSRQQGIRAAIRALREGIPLYYLPDQDYGPRDAVFVPFLGVPAATITGLSRLARLTGAVVIPCVTTMLPGGAGYAVKFFPAWESFPGADDAADARRMNAFIEARIQEAPEQYNWAHKRFKTRPPGAPRFYEN